MSSPDDHPRSDVAPPQVNERLAGDTRQPASRKGERQGGGRQGGDAGMAGWVTSLFGVKSGTRGLTILAVVGAGLLLVIGGAWNWIAGRHPQGVPVIGPPPYAVKDRPADPGGMMIMGDDTTKSDVTGRGAVHLAPPPEQPDAGLLAGRMGHPGSDGQSGNHSDGGADASPAQPADGREGRSGEEGAGMGEPARNGSAGKQAEIAHQADARKDSSQQHEPQKGHASGGDVTEQPLSPPAPLAPPLSSGEARREQRDATRQAGKEAGDASPASASLSDGMPASEAGHYEVQLAALQNDEQARQEWAHLKRRLPDLLGGHEPVLRKVERGGKSFVRLRVGGFADRAEARQLCVQLHAQAQACSVAAN